jgi:ABC-type transport system involved in multi-copper enzyme maturation permease subunit
MWNIIKAQNYQIKRDNFTYYALLLGVAIPFLFALSGEIDVDSLTGCQYVIYVGSTIASLIPGLFVLVLTSRICGWDYADKTINYEILAGHSRKTIYGSRVLTSFLWCFAGVIFMNVLPVIVFSVLHGWGNNMDFWGALLRGILVLFPLFRLICEFILLTFLLKNGYLSMIIGYVIYVISVVAAELVEEISDVTLTVQFTVSNIMSLMDFSNYKLGYVNGEDVMIFSTSLDGSLIIGTIGVSVVVGVICLLIGYEVFRKSDMS